MHHTEICSNTFHSLHSYAVFAVLTFKALWDLQVRFETLELRGKVFANPLHVPLPLV